MTNTHTDVSTRIELGRDNYVKIEKDEFGNLTLYLTEHGEERLRSILGVLDGVENTENES